MPEIVSDNINGTSIPQNNAVDKMRQTLLSEVDAIVGCEKIKGRNRRIKDDTIVNYYIKYLKKIGDPRYEYISEMLGDIVDVEIVDNELAHFLDLSKRFEELIVKRHSGETVGHIFDNLDFETQNALSNAVQKYDEREVLVLLSQFERPVVERVLLTAVGVNVALMIGHNLESTEAFAQQLYNSLSIGELSGKSVISLAVILPFLYEAIVKMRAQGVQNYLRNNKLDTFLNIAGVAEMGFMGFEAFGVTTEHAALGSLLRSLRILRIFRVTQKSKAFKDITDSLGESLPSMMKIAFTFWGYSILTTLFFMEIYSHHIPEFSGITHSFDSMTRLFFNDDAIGLNEKMRLVESIHPVTKEIAIWWARTYQFISNIFMIGIPPAIVYDVLVKNTTTKRYLAAILEALQGIKYSIEGLRNDIKETRKVTLAGFTRLKNTITPKVD